MARYLKRLLKRHTASPNESLVQPIQEQPAQELPTQEQPVQGKKWRETTIEVLPEDVLLDIFDFYRLHAMKRSQGRPWKWHRLAHVCRKWRDVISMSTRRLDLRILCKSEAPIESILASWPTLPLVATLDACWNIEQIPTNVMVALRHPDRLCEIDLHVTSSMLAAIVEVIQKPCQALESIRITVDAPTGSSMLVRNAFLGGSASHLREIKLDGIIFPFPELRQVLFSTENLVELHLANIPNVAYFSPNELVTGLSTLVQLNQLTIDFHSPASSPPPSLTRPLAQCTTLPSLMSLNFHGTSEYLEEFVGQIELPALSDIIIRLVNDIFLELPEFCKFIPRLNALRSPTRVIVKHRVDFVGVSFDEGQPLIENCLLGTSCRQLDWQLSFVTQITSQLSSHLSSVRLLEFQSGDELPTGEENVDSTEWLELFQLFPHLTQVYVSEKLVPRIMEALVAEDMTAEVFPELASLHLGQYHHLPSVAIAVERFVTVRKLSGRTVTLTSGDWRPNTLDLAEQQRQQQQLKKVQMQQLEEWPPWLLQKRWLRLEEKMQRLEEEAGERQRRVEDDEGAWLQQQ